MKRIIERPDLVSKDQFSKAHKISKSFLDKLIREDLLNCERIAGICYISITDEKVIQKALNSKKTPGTHTRNVPIKLKPDKPGSYDAQFDEAWEKWNREHADE